MYRTKMPELWCGNDKGKIKMSNHYKHLFGPVPSRRLGRSLGVDMVPFKTCSFDCVFCQLGRTTNKTVERKEYVPVVEIIDELRDWIESGGEADYITIAGSGEPTLNSEFGRVIDYIKSVSDIKVALLTNGSLLNDVNVREAAAKADVVKASLSCWDKLSFDCINRPADGLDIKDSIEGLQKLREIFNKQIWLEVFVVWGVNSISADISKIAEIVKTVNPDRVQLNTAVRPPAEDFVKAVSREKLEQLARLFKPEAEVIAEYSSEQSSEIKANEQTILEMLKRRPCTADQIADVFNMHKNEVAKYIGKLVRTDQIHIKKKLNVDYYLV